MGIQGVLCFRRIIFSQSSLENCSGYTTVYVAAVDATNAFPSTDQPTLWLKTMWLRLRMGMGLFDWLHMLYEGMEYYVLHGDRNSAEFKAFIDLMEPGIRVIYKSALRRHCSYVDWFNLTLLPIIICHQTCNKVGIYLSSKDQN